MSVTIIKEPIARERLREIAKERFGDLVKGAIDIKKGIMALGGELHIDEEVALIEKENQGKKILKIKSKPKPLYLNLLNERHTTQRFSRWPMVSDVIDGTAWKYWQ